MVANLWLIGRKRDAKAMFERLLALRNDVGLLAEEYDSDARAHGGEFSAGAVAYFAGACCVCDVGSVEAAALRGVRSSDVGEAKQRLEQGYNQRPLKALLTGYTLLSECRRLPTQP